MEKKELLYEGKSKKLYKSDDEALLIAQFKDDLTASNAGETKSKGVLNNEFSTKLFNILENSNIKTHFIKTLDDKTQLVKKVKVIPLEVIIRNVATGSLVKNFGIKECEELPFPLIELYYKNDDFGDPLVNSEHCLLLGIVKTIDDLNELRQLGREINNILSKFFFTCNIKLIDFKIEFGVDSEGNILLCDSISFDNCRLWDINSNEKNIVSNEEVLKRISNLGD